MPQDRIRIIEACIFTLKESQEVKSDLKFQTQAHELTPRGFDLRLRGFRGLGLRRFRI